MATYTWTSGETKTINFAAGDLINASTVPANVLATVNGNTLSLTAPGGATLTIVTPSLAILNIQFANNGKFHYASSDGTLIGGSGDDLVLGNDTFSDLEGGAGDDFVWGDAGDDALYGGGGHDILFGDAGRDVLDGGAGINVLAGGDGDDTYLVRNRLDFVYDSDGADKGTIFADWYKPSAAVENWTWAEGVQRLPYWIDAITYDFVSSLAFELSETRTVYYHFAKTPADFFDDEDRDNFHPFTAGQVEYTLKAFAYLSSLIDIRFEASSTPDAPYTIVLGNNDQEESGGYATTIWSEGGSLLLVATDSFAENPARDNGESLNYVLMHELGHTLGLKHPFANGQLDDSSEPPYLPAAEDITDYTVMSYNDGGERDVATYSMFDIAALQMVHGVSASANAGDTRFQLFDTGQRMIYDGAGTDLIDGSGLQKDLTLFLEPGYWSHAGTRAASITAPGQFTINFGTEIENASGGAGHDTITGNELPNRLTGNGGNDRIDGADGLDTVLFSGTRNSYTAAWSDGWLGVTDQRSGADGADLLRNVERISFKDASLALDVGADGVAGQVYRLYQAAFDRQPDAAGVGYWIAQADKGLAIRDIAANFLISKEFSDLYGGPNPSDASFVTLLYDNVLHRPYEQAGFNYWVGVLGNGQQRADVLQSFAASAENFDQVAKVIGGGFDFVPYG